jgi:hypothetical protein
MRRDVVLAVIVPMRERLAVEQKLASQRHLWFE